MIKLISNYLKSAHLRKALYVAAIAAGSMLSIPASAQLNVFACEPEWASLATSLGGNKVKVFSATTAQQDPHYIQARPSLLAKARRADFLACTGAELEIGWLPLLLRKTGNKDIQPGKAGHFMATDHVELIDPPKLLDRSQGDVHAAGNPHVHPDPDRLLAIAKKMSAQLQSIDPNNSAYYTSRLKSFERHWDSAIKRWKKHASQLKGSKIVTVHSDLKYLYNWLGIEVVADLEPSPGIPPTSAHLNKVVNIVNQQQPRYIALTGYQNRKSAEWLSAKTGLPVVVMPYTIGGDDQSTDLIQLMDRSLHLLKKG